MEKKGKATATAKKKPQSSASHPPYFQMIKEAITALRERTGSSPHAIAKYMEEKHKGVLPVNFRKHLANQLKNNTAKGNLVKVKASFKLSSSVKQDVKKAEKVRKPKVPVEAKKTKEVEKTKKTKAAVPSAGAKSKAVGIQKKAASSSKARKKPVVLKKIKKAAAPVKPKPKFIKGPAAKKARKAVA